MNRFSALRLACLWDPWLAGISLPLSLFRICLMHKTLAWIAPAVLGILAATSASAQDFPGLITPGKIVVGTTGSAPPTSMIDAGGNLAGYDIDLMTKVGQDLGVDVEFVQLDWAGLLPGLISGRFDAVASGVSRSKERLENPDLIMLEPYNVNGTTVISLASNTEINGWADVCGKPMGAVRGSHYVKTAPAQAGENCEIDVTEYPGWTEMLLDLKNRRIAWIGMDMLSGGYMSTTDSAIKVSDDVRAPAAQSVALSSRTPELAKAINELFAKYRASGEMDAMVKKWFGVTPNWAAIQ